MLENPRSPRVRAVAKLTKRSARQETGLFLLEGPQAAREALAYRPEAVLDAMADTVTPQGIVAVARQSPSSLKDVFAASPRLVAICEEVRDPGNLGTIIRAADAAGADAVVLTGRTVDPYNPKVVRATTGQRGCSAMRLEAFSPRISSTPTSPCACRSTAAPSR